MEENVFLGTLTHNGQLDARMAANFFSMASKERNVQYKVQTTSLLAGGCNSLWCTALNDREKNKLGWFAMLHADIVPDRWWVDKLISIAIENNADLVSAIVPIKGPDGVTSTAVYSGDPFRRFTRLTMSQILHPDMPPSFSINAVLSLNSEQPMYQMFKRLNPETARLLVNTGCMVCRLNADWCERAYFTINDRITKEYGKFNSETEPEDWFFSRLVADLGGRVMATRAVVVEHIGSINYQSNKIWGDTVDPKSLRIMV